MGLSTREKEKHYTRSKIYFRLLINESYKITNLMEKEGFSFF